MCLWLVRDKRTTIIMIASLCQSTSMAYLPTWEQKVHHIHVITIYANTDIHPINYIWFESLLPNLTILQWNWGRIGFLRSRMSHEPYGHLSIVPLLLCRFFYDWQCFKAFLWLCWHIRIPYWPCQEQSRARSLCKLWASRFPTYITLWTVSAIT